MPAQRFTDSFLVGLKPAGRPYKRRDRLDFKGFGIQVSVAGAKTFFLSYTLGGREQFMNLGRYRPPTKDTDGKPVKSNLVDRQTYARQMRGLVDQGIDPKEWEATQAADNAALGTFGDLLDKYLDSLGDRPSSAHARQIFDRDIRSNIDPSQAASDVTARMVSVALSKIVRRGAMTQANRAHSFLHAAFQYGLKFDNDPNDVNRQTRFYLKDNPVLDYA